MAAEMDNKPAGGFFAFMKRHRKKAFFLLGALLLLALIVRSDPEKVKEAFLRLSVADVFVLLLLQLATVLLINLQWLAILQRLGEKLPLPDILAMNFLGTFFESVTPIVKTGGEAYKVAFLKGKGLTSARSLGIVFTQKTVSIVAFCALFAAAILPAGAQAYFRTGGAPALWWGFLVSTLVFTAVFLLLLKRYGKRRGGDAAPNEPREGFWGDFRAAVRPLATDTGRFLAPYAVGLAFWLLYAFKTYFLFQAFGIGLGYFSAMVATFSGYMAGLLPLAPGGLGTFEGAAVGVLVFYGLAAASATTLVLTLRLATFWLMLALSALYLALKEGLVALKGGGK